LEHDSRHVSQVDELTFFGRVAASVSHELSNIVSTIHQVSGLLEDLIASAERGQPTSTERLKMIHGRLSRQTARGIEVIQNLNRFAHNVDERPVLFDVNSVIGNLIAVMRRFADLKDVDLEVSYSSEEIHVFNDPFCLQQVVFLAVDQALGAAGRGDVLRIVVQREVSGPAVKIVAPRPSGLGDKDSPPEPLQVLAERLRSKIIVRPEGDSECILLEISGAQPPPSFRPTP
jgi:C4-dicarboxylate-specific signal transduction histidine kinase